MSELNFDLLEKNISILIQNQHITQLQLAKITGMTQANVSKALNPHENKHFTLEHIYRISQYFGVSIDKLVGNTAPEQAEVNPRTAFEFIIKFLCAKKIRTAEMVVKETKYEHEDGMEGYAQKETEVTYPVFYFPDYEQLSDYFLSPSDEPAYDLHMEFCSVGNQTSYSYLNEVLKKIIPLTQMYLKEDIPEEAFQMIVKGYLDGLPEK